MAPFVTVQIIKAIKDMRSLSRSFRSGGRSVGFVPTMGALHEGHLSLVRRSVRENEKTIVSVFINPTQFGPHEDFKRYPRDEEGDLAKLSALGVDVVFMPDNNEMYPEGFSITINTGDIGQTLCGISRPGHFNGVATVVAKLFNVIVPDRAYFGQKDFQQTVVIRKLVKELNFDVEIIVCPIVREPDGLAMSSRNIYLNEEERKSALVLYKALKLGKDLILSKGMNDSASIINEMKDLIESETRVRLEYVDVVDTENLSKIHEITLPVVILLAVRVGNTRLIDNIMLKSD